MRSMSESRRRFQQPFRAVFRRHASLCAGSRVLMQLSLAVALIATGLMTTAATAQSRDGEVKVGQNIRESHVPYGEEVTWLAGPPPASNTWQDGVTNLIIVFSSNSGRWIPAIEDLVDVSEAYQGLPSVYRLQIAAISYEDKDEVRTFVGRYFPRSRIPVGQVKVDDSRNGSSQSDGTFKALAESIREPVGILVDGRGVVQWIGGVSDPKLPEVIPSVAIARFDAKLYQRTDELREAFKTNRKVRNWRLAETNALQIMAVEKKIFGLYAIELFKMRLVDQENPAAAYAWVDTVIQANADDPILLLIMATTIAGDTDIPDDKRNFKKAHELVDAAAEVLENTDPVSHSVRAFVAFHEGDIELAAREQRRAWRYAKPEVKEQLKPALDKYAAAVRRQRDGIGKSRR